MNLELQDIRRSSDDDRYVWAPFELNDQFNGDWWDSPPYLTDDPHFVLARAQGIEVARVELDHDFRGSLHVGALDLGASALEIQFIEVAASHRRQGIGAEVVERLAAGPVATGVPKVADYLASWLADVVEPNLAPKTYEKYETFTRLHIAPYLGTRRLDKIAPRDVRTWLNQLRQACQCCAQGTDTRRREADRRCCAIGACCHRQLSPRSLKDARDTLRAALGHAMTEDELINRNPAAMVKLPTPRSRKVRAWSVAEACAFLDAARTTHDPLYAAYVLMLVLGLRRGEALGLLWTDVHLDSDELDVAWQLQRSGRQLHHRQTKTGHSDAALPLPGICTAALKHQAEAQELWRRDAGPAWHASGLVMTTTYGTPYEPRNFNRHYAARCKSAGVRYIQPHGMRRTCASFLAALDVHPRVAMRILRHSKIAVTMEIYTDVPDQVTRDALRRLGAQLDG